MNVAKPIKRAGFREGIRNTFLRYALYPILALVALWGGAVLMYSFFAAQGANRIVNEQMMNVLAKQYTAYETMLLEAEREPELMASLVENASLAQITRANEILYAFNNRQTIRSIFYLFNSKGELISSNTWEEREGFTIEKRFSPYVIEQIRQKRKRQIYQLTVRRQTPGERNTVFTMSASLWRGTEIAGYLVFDLQENDFTQFTSSTDVNYTVITDRYHNALATNDTGILGAVSKFSPLVQGDGHVNLGGNHMYLTIGLREGCPFQVFTLTSLALLNQIFLFGLLFIPATSLLLILLMTRLARRVVEKNATHLDELIQSVEAMRQGNYQYQFTSGNEHTDEFAYLSEQYQFLFRRIGRLVEVNRELANARRLTEIRQLEAQFNPHFIFNVLETIKYEMLINKESAAEIINLLAKLLRYCISREGDTVTLRHDLEYIKTYLALQKVRYDENLTYEIFIPQELLDCRMPKLILQPLVENCIAHGYVEKEAVHITITASQIGQDIQIRVVDNGDGIPDARLEEIKAQLDFVCQETKHVGLFNSHRRLQLMYGKRYGVQITSVPKVGTEVMLSFPVNGCEPKETPEGGESDV